MGETLLWWAAAAAPAYAQAPPAAADPISGGGGWVGAGLLGVVLAWLLLKHIPDKDRQTERLIEGCDKQIAALVDGHDRRLAAIVTQFEASLRDTRADFRLTLDTINQQHDRHVGQMVSAMHEEFAQLRRGPTPAGGGGPR